MNDFLVYAKKTVKALNDASVVSLVSHWNVRGANYYETHLLFERVYGSLSELMDGLVERLRACGYDPDFEELSGPGISMGFFDAPSLVELNLDYVMALAATLTLFFDFTSQAKGDPRMTGLADLLQSMSSEVLQAQYLLLAATGR